MSLPVKPVLALSTCWNSHRHTDGFSMLQEAADLGFSHVELSHGTRIVLVPGILKALEAGVIKVSSTHNFCPLPTGIVQSAPNLFEPSALDEREHEQWLRHTKRSIDFTAQIRGKLVVLHLGSVKFFWLNPANKLAAYEDRHPDAVLTEDKTYQTMLAKACTKLRGRMPRYWARVQQCIEEVREYAVKKGVSLGFENREKFEELPLDDDFVALFNDVKTPNTFGYWHDTGHAQIKQSMGLLQQEAHLEKLSGRLLGFHLHDVSSAGKDHQPIGTGSVDFKMISGFWRPEHLLTLELSPRVTVEEVKTSKARIEELIAARFGG